MSRKSRGRRNTGTFSVTIIVLAVLFIMSVQIMTLKKKNDQYKEREAELIEQYEAETERSQEINDLADYMKTDQYIEDIAKSKLGLAYENEIIFKESED